MFVSVIPAVRTPFGVDVFDYQIDDVSKLQSGDLIQVAFRKKIILALVVEFKTTSPYANRAISVLNPEPIVRLGSAVIPLLTQTATRTFNSRSTILYSWVRTVPKRISTTSNESAGLEKQTSGIRKQLLCKNRLEILCHEARSTSGRALIITPWKHRADVLAKILNTSALHADIADGTAWKNWVGFIEKKESILVTTRLGAWLAACADTIILDEPENDDFKQDELAPRFDARWLVERAAEIKPILNLIEIGTTPRLAQLNQKIEIPDIELDLKLEPWQKGSYSKIDNLSSSITDQISTALEENKNVTILHPIKGERSRITCRDCSWTMKCPACSFPLSRVGSTGRCGRCARSEDMPQACPSCGGSDLNKARAGKDRLAEQAKNYFQSPLVQVVDMPDWNRLALKQNSLIILTDLSLIGGFTEDIRRRERLIIAWRRLAAAVASANGTLLVQGPEELLAQARGWISSAGLAAAWQKELAERTDFGYPPVQKRIKLLINGSLTEAENITTGLPGILPDTWKIEGPYPVLFRSKTRSERYVAHIVPPTDETEEKIVHYLEPLAGKVIIDLDPIAFFS